MTLVSQDFRYIDNTLHFSMQILDGRIVASTILDRIRSEITYAPQGERPMLAVVLVGDNPASLAYIRMKERRAREVGMGFWVYRYPTTITQWELEEAVKSLGQSDSTHGIIVQAPLPSHIDRYRVTECIPGIKDVDGFTREQIGNMYLGHEWLWSCTPKGIMTLLSHYDISVVGKRVAVLGRSNIVGKPMTLMLVNAWATVTSCNRETHDLANITQSADIVIIAIGSPRFLTRGMVRPETIIIDVGSTFVDDTPYGDADYEDLVWYVRAITPAPGWVWPMTVATLIENTWIAYTKQKGR
jgi:methylenetetrahydrofolate dehydrogenase (NADP+) / methenyltetrahydrofolate cyclohydrolase